MRGKVNEVGPGMAHVMEVMKAIAVFSGEKA